jgi:hypothetical protein
MKTVKHFACGMLSIVVLLALQSISTQAQTTGENTVYSGSSFVASPSFVDASVVVGPGGATDICARIFSSLVTLASAPYNGAGVVDARGITSSSVMTCPTGDTPWYYGGTYESTPAVILLPAGTIALSTTWLLPDRTKLIGEGAGANDTAVTTLQAPNGTFTAGVMIQMGATTSTQTYKCPGTGTSLICFAVGVEDLRLDGQGNSVIGILNDASQEQSYVNRVTMYQVETAGLLVGGTVAGTGSTVVANSHAQNSGPYTNIRFEILSTSTYSPTASTICVQIMGSTTRGVHGLSCHNSSSTTPNAAIYLDALNTTIEDVYVSGFTDGIVVGADAAAGGTYENGSILLNIAGSLSGNLVHICNPEASNSGNCANTSTTGVTVSDLSILSASNPNTATGAESIQDDETNTPLKGANGDTHVGTYILGEQIEINTSPATYAFSRFSTSPRVPTWASGSGLPTTSAGGCNSATNGSLYSNTGGASGSTLYACVAGKWTDID